MTRSRALALGALVAALGVVAFLLLGEEYPASYKVRFENAGQLVNGDDVQVGGRRMGTITDVELTDDNQAEVSIAVAEDFAPLHEGTTATIRATSLSGIANRYIALTPGPNSAPELDDGATLRADKTTPIVDLDQLFNTLDARTRKSLQDVIQGSATWYDGKGAQANEAAKYFNPALSASRRLVTEVIRDQGDLDAFLENAAKVTGAIAERRDDLSRLVANANRTTAAIGDENASLGRALELLPGTLRKANTTFVNLRATLDDLDVLVAESKPATKDLARFLRELRPLVTSARPTIRDLRTLVRSDGEGDDLTDLLRSTPALERAARPAFANSITALRRATPVLKFIRPYTPDFVGWLRDFGQGAANYDANGHFARIQPMFNAYSFTDDAAGGTLTPVPADRRLAGLQTDNIRRCPGTASQPPADGSAPWRDSDGSLDCDPSLVLPGP